MDSGNFFLRQLFDRETWTYTYLIADSRSREAALIDTVKEQVERDLNYLKELDLNLKYVMETHVHADHVTGAGDIREATGAKSVLGAPAEVACADRLVQDGDEIKLGETTIRALATPGHTNACVSYYVDGRVFTGDALFIRGTGRTDFQGGSSETLYQSITQKLFHLPDNTLVYPGHDYHGMSVSTIGEEKLYNPRVGQGKSQEDFVRIMASLNLDLPKNIQMALPANLACGDLDSSAKST